VPIASVSALDGVFDVCIVGAGPAGLSAAFTCHQRGLRVLLLEAGGKRPVPGDPDVLAAEIADTNSHDPVEIVAASALGGSSHWWGGRAVPLDPIDLRTWPIAYEELRPWYDQAARMIGAGAVLEHSAPGRFAMLERFHATHGETWAPDPILSRLWRNRIRAPDGPTIVLGVRVTGFQHVGARVAALEAHTRDGQKLVRAAHIILACGGLGGIRMLLLAQQKNPRLFGGVGGPLGRGYMGHLVGSIADIVLDNPADVPALGAFNTGRNYVARRRILPHAQTITSEDIGNIAFWISAPMVSDPSHGSAGASARFLAAVGVRMLAGKSPGAFDTFRPHIANIRRAPVAAAIGVGQAAWTLATVRLIKQRHAPRRISPSSGNSWRLLYHAEHKSDSRNRISLSEKTDSLGLPKLSIDFRFRNEDAAPVVRAHDLLDADLRKAGAGSLRWRPESNRDGSGREEAVLSRARDGYHQIGGAAMSVDPAQGVVDRDCRVHGVENLWVASSSVFPTGGQANPTLTIIALACRAAERIASLQKQASLGLASGGASAIVAQELSTDVGNNPESQREQTGIDA
jgi:uncharacterized protein YoaH (UPF0181 family)